MPKRSAGRLKRGTHPFGAPVNSLIDSDWIVVALQIVLGLKVALVLLVVDPIAADSFDLVKSTVSHACSVIVLILLLLISAKYGLQILRPTPIRITAIAY